MQSRNDEVGASDRIEMECADEDMQLRSFVLVDITEDGVKDFTCEHCGWMQSSAAGGAAELCLSANWGDPEAYVRYAQIARNGGFIVPDEPRAGLTRLGSDRRNCEEDCLSEPPTVKNDHGPRMIRGPGM